MTKLRSLITILLALGLGACVAPMEGGLDKADDGTGESDPAVVHARAADACLNTFVEKVPQIGSGDLLDPELQQLIDEGQAKPALAELFSAVMKANMCLGEAHVPAMQGIDGPFIQAQIDDGVEDLALLKAENVLGRYNQLSWASCGVLLELPAEHGLSPFAMMNPPTEYGEKVPRYFSCLLLAQSPLTQAIDYFYYGGAYLSEPSAEQLEAAAAKHTARLAEEAAQAPAEEPATPEPTLTESEQQAKFILEQFEDSQRQVCEMVVTGSVYDYGVAHDAVVADCVNVVGQLWAGAIESSIYAPNAGVLSAEAYATVVQAVAATPEAAPED